MSDEPIPSNPPHVTVETNYPFEQATEGSWGFDLHADRVIENSERRVKYGTGCKIISKAFMPVIVPRSSIGSADPPIVLANSVGIIDSDYRGEIEVWFQKMTPDMSLPYKTGDRIAQCVFLLAAPAPTIQTVDTIENDTERGEGGFGSTGE